MLTGSEVLVLALLVGLLIRSVRNRKAVVALVPVIQEEVIPIELAPEEDVILFVPEPDEEDTQPFIRLPFFPGPQPQDPAE